MRRHILSLLFGLLGILVGLAGWHLYQDHQLVDAIRFNAMRQQQAGQK